jgi:phage shock protein E
MKFILKHKISIIGIIAGAIGGYLFYHFIGCSNGTCAITSKPLNSTLYGAMMGGLFFNILKNKKFNT